MDNHKLKASIEKLSVSGRKRLIKHLIKNKYDVQKNKNVFYIPISSLSSHDFKSLSSFVSMLK